MARAAVPRLTWRAAPTQALAPGWRRPRGRGRSTRRVLPRVEASHGRMRARLCGRATPCYGKAAWATRWHLGVGECVGASQWQRGAQESSTRRRTRAAAYPPDTHPPLWAMPTMRRCCAVWQARAAAAPWRAPPGGLGAPPRRARGLWTPSVVCVRRCAAAWGAQEALGARAPLHPDRPDAARSSAARFFCPRSHTRPKYR